VEKLLQESMREGGKSFKRALNEAVRQGLKGGGAVDERPFEVVARPLGLQAGIDPARLHEIEDDQEVEEFLRKSEALKSKAG